MAYYTVLCHVFELDDEVMWLTHHSFGHLFSYNNSSSSSP